MHGTETLKDAIATFRIHIPCVSAHALDVYDCVLDQ